MEFVIWGKTLSAVLSAMQIRTHKRKGPGGFEGKNVSLDEICGALSKSLIKKTNFYYVGE